MSIDQQLLYLFSGLGAVNGLLLGGYFLLVKKSRRLSDYFLGGLLLMLSVRILKSVFLHFNPGLFQLFIQVGLAACLLIGPFLYLYVISATQKSQNLKQRWWLYLVPFLLFIGWLAYNHPHDGPPYSWNPYVPTIYNIWLLCILAAGFQMRGVLRRLLQKEKSISTEESWLLNVYFGVFLIYIGYATASYTSYLAGALSFSFIIYISLLLLFYQHNLKPIAKDPPIKYSNSTLQAEEAATLMQQLDALMTEHQYYLDPKLTIAGLSKQIGIPGKELSQAINQSRGYNYSQYIATLRVAEAKRLLHSPKHQHYKIAAIAFESGFNSLSSFNAAFKQIAGTTANTYRKQA
ncbi:MAG: helix-turn-helix domain-containing protein [Bacteroidota bacterium]